MASFLLRPRTDYSAATAADFSTAEAHLARDLAFQRLGRPDEGRAAHSKALAIDPACEEARLFSLVRSISNQAALLGLGTFSVASQFLSVKLEELTMPRKISAPSKTIDPKEQPARRSDDQVAPAEPDDRQHPPRDTRETPAPNPNDKGLPNRAPE